MKTNETFKHNWPIMETEHLRSILYKPDYEQYKHDFSKKFPYIHTYFTRSNDKVSIPLHNRSKFPKKKFNSWLLQSGTLYHPTSGNLQICLFLNEN